MTKPSEHDDHPASGRAASWREVTASWILALGAVLMLVLAPNPGDRSGPAEAALAISSSRMSESDQDRNRDRDRRTAEAVREACVRAVIDGYQDAAISGLCHEGAVEASVSAVRMVDVDAIIEAQAKREPDER